MQIHELNNFTGTLGSGAYLAIDDGTDTGKISSQGLLAATEARIDNIIAGPAPSAEEIVDARLGADGVTYPSLGDAIRDQFTDVKSAINYLSDGLVITPYETILNKGFDRDDGTFPNESNWDITDYIPVVGGEKIYVDNTLEQTGYNGWYTASKSYIGWFTVAQGSNIELVAPENAAYVVLTNRHSKFNFVVRQNAKGLATKNEFDYEIANVNKDVQSSINSLANGGVSHLGTRKPSLYINYQGKAWYGYAQESKVFELSNGAKYTLKIEGGNAKRIGFTNGEYSDGMALNDYSQLSSDTYSFTNSSNYKYLYVYYTDNAATTAGDAFLLTEQNYYETKDEATEYFDILCNAITDSLTFSDGYYSNTLYYNSNSDYQTSSLFELESGEKLTVFGWAYTGAVSVVTICDSAGTAQSVGVLSSDTMASTGTWYEYTNNTTSKQYIKVSYIKSSYNGVVGEIYKTSNGMGIVRQLIATGGATPKTFMFMGDSLTCLRDYPSLINNGNTNINVGVAGATFMRYTDSDNKGVSFYDFVTAMVNDDTSLQEEIISRYTDPRITACIQRFIDLDFSTVDAIVFWYGMNDYLRNKELGTATETDYSKVIPCVEYGLNLLSANFPTVQLYCVGNSYTDRSNTLGLTPMDYANAVKAECEKYAVPFYDMYHLGNVNAVNHESRLEDGIHQNAFQNAIVAEKIANFIKV